MIKNQLPQPMSMFIAVFLLTTVCHKGTLAQKSDSRTIISAAADKVEPKVIAWRQDIHEHPELGNREIRTAALVAKHLQSLGIEVTTNVAVTGVVGILKGGQPGPVVALRADMDALPVLEKTDNNAQNLKLITHANQNRPNQ